MSHVGSIERGSGTLTDANRRFYDRLWSEARRVAPQRFNSWGVVSRLVAGMRNRLVGLGMWFLERNRVRSRWWYNRVLMPLALRFAKPLVLREGLGNTEGVDTILLVCRKAGPTGIGMSR